MRLIKDLIRLSRPHHREQHCRLDLQIWRNKMQTGPGPKNSLNIRFRGYNRFRKTWS